MRKVLPAVAFVFIIAAALIICNACAITEEQVRSDPGGVVSQAILLSGAEFMSFDSESEGKMLDAILGGSVELSLEGNRAWGMMLGEEYENTSLKATLYSDMSGGKCALTLDGRLAGRELSAEAFLDKDGMTVNSESLLGGAYSFTPSVIADSLSGSALQSMLGLSDEDTDAICELMRSFEEPDDGIAESKMYYEALGYEVDSRIIGGKPVIVVTLHLDNAAFAELVRIYKENADPIGESRAELEKSMDELVSDVNAAADFDAEIRIYIDKWGGKLHNIGADIELVPKTGEYTGVTLVGKAIADINANDMEFLVRLDSKLAKGLGYELSIIGKKERTGDTVSYMLDGVAVEKNGGNISETVLLDASFDYNKSDYGFSFSAAPGGGITAECRGEIKPDSSGVTVLIEKIGANGVHIDPGVEIRYNCDARMPSESPNANELVLLGERELREIFDRLDKGLDLPKVGGLIGQLQSGSEG